MRKTILTVVVIAVLAVTVSGILISVRSRAATMESGSRRPQVDQEQTIAGPGLVEPLSEDIKLGSELSEK